MRIPLLLASLLVLPGPLPAQSAPEEPAPDRVEAAAAALLRTGEIAGIRGPLLGGWVGIVFGDRFVLGGGGTTLLEDVDLPGLEGSTGFDLRMGYGGVILKYRSPLSPRLTGEGGFLLGAGHAEVRDRLAGIEVGAENFLTLEPEVILYLDLFRGTSVGVGLGYRFAWGVEDLPRATAQDLRSALGSLSLRIGG